MAPERSVVAADRSPGVSVEWAFDVDASLSSDSDV